jgi:hypothetical protein
VKRTSDTARLEQFARYGRLDAYELTDEEIARLLEVWRYEIWRDGARTQLSDRQILDAVKSLQRRLAYEHDIEIEYNTLLLLKTEIEPLANYAVLRDGLRALCWFLHPLRWWTFARVSWRARRYRKIDPARVQDELLEGYPIYSLNRFRGRAPDLLKRKYYRPFSAHSYEERKKLDEWS